jgi:peroxiredoxin
MNSSQDKCPTCGATLAGGLCRQCLLRAGLSGTPTSKGDRWDPPTPEELEAQLTKYQVLELIGHGGMGAVYKGWQTSLEREVAIKVLPPALMDEDFTARFKQEARTMARLSHPAIVSVYDFDETADGLCYIVMEYVEGTDVQRMIASEGILSPDHALAIAINVSDALSYAHEHGIIHRDIKPANVMVDTEGRVKVADFGLAKVTQEGAALLTGTNVSLGTPGYIAPEVLTAGMNLDGRVDLYSVGVMLYAMLTGKVPHGRFEAASERVPGLDPHFDDIVNRAMQNEREARYASAAELRADLTKMLAVPVEQASAQFAEVASSTHLENQSREATQATGGGTSVEGRPSLGGASAKARLALIGLAAAVSAIGMFVWKPWSHEVGQTVGVAAVSPASPQAGVAVAGQAATSGPGQIIDLLALPDLDLRSPQTGDASVVHKVGGQLRIEGVKSPAMVHAPMTILGHEYELEVGVGKEFGTAVWMRIPLASSFVDVVFNSLGAVSLASVRKTGGQIIPSGDVWPVGRPITLKLRVKLGAGGLDDELEAKVGDHPGVTWRGRLADHQFKGGYFDPRPGLLISPDVKTIESFTLRMIQGEAKLLRPPASSSSLPAAPKPETGAGPAVDFKFTADDGREADTAKLRGEVVVVDFLATWCAPCMGELPHVVEANRRFHDQGFENVGISFDQDQAALQRVTGQNGTTWPQYSDGKGWQNAYGVRYGIHSIPTMWLINKQGRIATTNAREDLAGQVEKLLAGEIL